MQGDMGGGGNGENYNSIINKIQLKNNWWGLTVLTWCFLFEQHNVDPLMPLCEPVYLLEKKQQMGQEDKVGMFLKVKIKINTN